MEPLYLNDADIQNLVSPKECAAYLANSGYSN